MIEGYVTHENQTFCVSCGLVIHEKEYKKLGPFKFLSKHYSRTHPRKQEKNETVTNRLLHLMAISIDSIDVLKLLFAFELFSWKILPSFGMGEGAVAHKIHIKTENNKNGRRRYKNIHPFEFPMIYVSSSSLCARLFSPFHPLVKVRVTRTTLRLAHCEAAAHKCHTLLILMRICSRLGLKVGRKEFRWTADRLKMVRSGGHSGMM